MDARNVATAYLAVVGISREGPQIPLFSISTRLRPRASPNPSNILFLHNFRQDTMATIEKVDSPMHHISSPSLLKVSSRLSYTTSFLSFTPDDGAAINASEPLLAPLLPKILDLVYTKLLAYDITAAVFVPRQGDSRETGPAPAKAQGLSLTHSRIMRQKDFLKGYLVKILNNENWTSNSPLWEYLDKVGIAHTGLPGLKHRVHRQDLRVEYMHIGLLLGYLEEILVGIVLGLGQLDTPTKKAVLSAWNKLLWIQNDLFARHYVVDEGTGEMPRGVTAKADTTKMMAYGVVGGLVGVVSTMAYGYLGA